MIYPPCGQILLRRAEGLKDRWKKVFKESKRPLEGSLSNLGKITFEVARSTTEKRFWNYLIDKYHCPGYRRVIGNQVKYLIYKKMPEYPSACWEDECPEVIGGRSPLILAFKSLSGTAVWDKANFFRILTVPKKYGYCLLCL